jgi:hypothetical protein
VPWGGLFLVRAWPVPLTYAFRHPGRRTRQGGGDGERWCDRQGGRDGRRQGRGWHACRGLGRLGGGHPWPGFGRSGGRCGSRLNRRSHSTSPRNCSTALIFTDQLVGQVEVKIPVVVAWLDVCPLQPLVPACDEDQVRPAGRSGSEGLAVEVPILPIPDVALGLLGVGVVPARHGRRHPDAAPLAGDAAPVR